MKKIILAILLLGGCLIAGGSYLHYKGYDRRIVRKVYRVIQRKHRPTNEAAGYYSVMFNDMNDVHLSSARRLGLKQPLKNRTEADAVKSRLVRIRSNQHYTVDKLTYSVPYLTEGASELLDMIGQNFLDSLNSKGMNSNKIIVTSVLRTQEDIKRLQKSGNVNASSNSAHCYGTTFDITYARYDKMTGDTRILTKVLGEVLLDLKKQKRCYVKYEVRQRCFHITTRI